MRAPDVFSKIPSRRTRCFAVTPSTLISLILAGTALGRQLTRLKPESYPGLPPGVVLELQRRGCTIPQTPSPKKPHNAIRGEFAKRGQTDWAVLCSVKGVSTILVFWGGSGRNPAAFRSSEDSTFFQSDGGGRMVFSREITSVEQDWIMRHYRAYGGPKPPPINHQGIDDAYVGKASVTYYFHNGKWLALSGAD